MRLLLAARLSQDRAGQTGIDTQDQDARSWAERNNPEVIATVADKISGRTSPLDRPNLGPWLTDPALRVKYDGIVVSKLDRLSRGQDWGIRSWAEEHGKKLLIVSPELCWPPEPGDTATRLIWDNLVSIASAEWENTSIRYRRMQEHLRSTKSFVGRPPFGYAIAGEAKAKTLVPDPVRADAIRTVVALYLSGKSLSWLCAYLDAEGIPTRRGGSWVPKTLSDVFRNPVLAGRQVNGKGRTILKVPPILDQDTWRKLQAELDRKASKKGVAQAGTSMLGGVAVCAKCGGPMYRLNAYNTRKDGMKIDLFYMRCWGTPTEPSRCKNMYPLEELEARVERFMTATLAWLPRYETVTVPGHGHEEEIYEVERDLRELDFDDPDFAGKQAALLAERARLRALPPVPASIENKATGDTIGEYWASLKTDAEKREFLQRLGMVVRVRRGKPREEADPFSEDIPDVVSFETCTGSGFLDEFLPDPPQEQGATS